MSGRASLRVRRSRLATFESLERRICLSFGGVAAWADDSWNWDEPNLVTSSVVQFNQAITSDSAVQNSPSLTVSPTDPSHLVLAYLDYSLTQSGYAGIEVAVSHNAGTTWVRNSVNLPVGFEQGASDPIAKFDSEGHVFISFMAASFKGASIPPILNPGGGKLRALGFEANNGIFVARSDDGGLTWAPPVAVSSHLFDGITNVPFDIYPDMAVDNVKALPDGRMNPNFGNLYVTWGRYYPAGQFPGEANASGGSDVMIAVSRDHGETWQLRTQPRANSQVVDSVLQMTSNTGTEQAAGLGFMNWPRVTVGALGDVSVADFGGGWFLVNHSSDAGETFFVPSRENFEGLPFGSGGKLLTAGLTNNSFRTIPTRGIIADPVRPGFLYAAEPLPVFDALGNPVDSAEIFFARSENFGISWKSIKLPGSLIPRSVNDDNGGKRSDGSPENVVADQFMVRMQVNAKGDLGLVWYDTRRDPANHLLDVFAAVSTDGGKTFSPNFRVTDQSFDADQGTFTDAIGMPLLFIGDTIGLAMSEQSFYVAWTDTREGNQDIFFAPYLWSRFPCRSMINLNRTMH